MSEWKDCKVYQILLLDNQFPYPWYTVSKKMYLSADEYMRTRTDNAFRAVRLIQDSEMPLGEAAYLLLYGGDSPFAGHARIEYQEERAKACRRRQYEKLKAEFDPG